MKAPQFWYDMHAPHAQAKRCALIPFSWVYQAASCLRAKMATPHVANVPVICVGNIVAGGAGKTPIVAYISRLLESHGRTPHIVMRGYKGQAAKTQGRRVLPQDTAADVGDEAIILRDAAPVWIGSDRRRSITAAIADGADVIVMDDGFQNPYVYKNISLLVLDARGIGNGTLLPAGPLREMPQSAFARADAVILSDVAGDVQLPTGVRVFRASIVPHNASILERRKVHGFAGIGDPQKFARTLSAAGAELAAFTPFADHHAYQRDEVDALIRAAESDGALLCTTRKDAVKIAEDQRAKMHVVDIDVTLDNAFDDFLMSEIAAAADMCQVSVEENEKFQPGYIAGAIGVYLVYGFFALLPLQTASALGGRMGKLAGRHVLRRQSKRALENIARAFPEKSADQHADILDGMWDNVGRVIAEYPHLHTIWDNITLDGAENIVAARDDGKAGILFAGHISNWEIQAIAAKRYGLDLHLVYREPNNSLISGLLRHARNSGAAGHIRKGGQGAREIFSLLRKGQHVGMLVDQKLNEGVPVPFFGMEAMTAPAIALMALKLDCPLFPARVERLNGARFRMTAYPALRINKTGDKDADVYNILCDINALLESWIRERPEQWLWMHRRWDQRRIHNSDLIVLRDDEPQKFAHFKQLADCLIITADNKLCLQRRSANAHSFPGAVCLFGGHVEGGETALTAAVREVAEETGGTPTEADMLSLGVLAENGDTLIHIYVWHDKNASMTGCYEGERITFDSAADALAHADLMPYAGWAIKAAKERLLIL